MPFNAIYEEFSTEMIQRKEAVYKQFKKLDQKLSNLKELIKFICG
jgi:hypothetical protein